MKAMKLMAVLAVGIGFLQAAPARADAESPAPAPAEETSQSMGVVQFEGTYVRTGGGCAFAEQATLSEETEAGHGATCYHLKIIKHDGKTWSSREFRQLNGAPWYKADLGSDGTVSGRSRFSCGRTGCSLWNERKTCSSGLFPRCGSWESSQKDVAELDGTHLVIHPEAEVPCVFTLQPAH